MNPSLGLQRSGIIPKSLCVPHYPALRTSSKHSGVPGKAAHLGLAYDCAGTSHLPSSSCSVTLMVPLSSCCVMSPSTSLLSLKTPKQIQGPLSPPDQKPMKPQQVGQVWEYWSARAGQMDRRRLSPLRAKHVGPLEALSEPRSCTPLPQSSVQVEWAQPAGIPT